MSKRHALDVWDAPDRKSALAAALDAQGRARVCTAAAPEHMSWLAGVPDREHAMRQRLRELGPGPLLGLPGRQLVGDGTFERLQGLEQLRGQASCHEQGFKHAEVHREATLRPLPRQAGDRLPLGARRLGVAHHACKRLAAARRHSLLMLLARDLSGLLRPDDRNATVACAETVCAFRPDSD